VQRLKAENNISFVEARKAAAAENESRPSHDTRTAAEVVRLRSEPPPPATRSIKIQTELTCPDDQGLDLHEFICLLPVNSANCYVILVVYC